MAILGILLTATACTKTGATGPKGDTGPQGPIGNANVFTDTFSLANADWAWNSAYGYTTGNNAYVTYFTRYHDVTFSKVTQGMLDTGMVMVFINPYANSTNQWAPMPYTFLNFGSQYYFNFVFETMPGKVRLHYFYTANGSGTTPTTLGTDVIPTHRYKIVAVGGTISTALKRDHIDIGNYQALMDYLGN